MDALKLLTLDCWREVLDRVKDPEDLKACSETCVIFEELLMRKMNVFLFELILPIIFEYLPVGASLKPVYDCRAVCKDWCKSVDQFAETASSNGHLFEYMFDDGDTTERFLNMFATHVGNPFVGRRVAIEHRSTLLMAPPQEDDQNDGVPQAEIFHITKIRQLLSRFGKEIWALELFENNQNQHLALCKNIPTVLSKLPNLRKLKLDKFFGTLQEENMEELPAYIAANPLPSLPHLEDLSTFELHPVMTRYMLEKYSLQLKYFTTCWVPSNFPWEFPRFNCLKELYLDYLDANVSLQGFQQLHSPLEVLSLDIQYNRQRLTLWPIDYLFRSIHHLPIRKLELANWSNVFVGESAQIFPELRTRHESISEIRISSSRGVSLNFLVSCSKLETFFIDHRGGSSYRHPNGVAEVLDVTDDAWDLYQSNIWEAIPCLQNFTLSGVFDGSAGNYRWIETPYNRKTYEENKREKADAGRP